MAGRKPQGDGESCAMAQRRLIAILANHPIAEMLAVTLRQMNLPVFAMVGDLDGPNKMQHSALWIEDGALLDDPETEEQIQAVIGGFVDPQDTAPDS